MSQKRSGKRPLSDTDSNLNLMRMPGHATGSEALGFAASLIIIALVLSYFSHRFGVVNRSIIPMHAPVLLAGMILSPVYAAIVGLMTPAILSGLTGYPLYGQALRLMIELGLCGFITAFMLSLLTKNKQSATQIEWMIRGAVAVVIGLFASFVGFAAISLIDVGNSGFGYFLETFFASSLLTFLIVLVAVPFLGLKFRKSAHH